MTNDVPNKSLKTGKAARPDTINNRILKELLIPLSSSLCDLFNYSLTTGQFLEAWKQANITPIYKKDDSSEPSKYRLIAERSTKRSWKTCS